MLELISQRLTYRALTEQDVSTTYVNWLNDPEVNQYLETRHTPQTIESCKSYVSEMSTSPAHYLFGVYLRESNQHIGNTKLGFINQYHKRAQLSLFIGEKQYWGKGFAVEIIKTITDWGFSDLDLEKIDAGCYDENLGSLRAFLKSGYQVEGYFRKSVAIGDRRIGSFWMSILKDERQD